MRIDTQQELAEMIDAHGLQDFLEAVADICNDKSERVSADAADWRRAARKLRDLAATPGVEAVS